MGCYIRVKVHVDTNYKGASCAGNEVKRRVRCARFSHQELGLICKVITALCKSNQISRYGNAYEKLVTLMKFNVTHRQS